MKFELDQTATTRRTFTRADLAGYASLTGIILPEGARVLPGPFLGGMFSYLLGTQLPGRGTNYLKQHLEFPRAAFIDEELTATVQVVRLRPEKHLVNLRTVCTNPAGQVVCEGEALVLVKDVQNA